MTSLASMTAIAPAAALGGGLRVPGDKSIAHRALIVNALSGGPAAVSVRSPGADVLSTAACLRALGLDVDAAVDGEMTRFTVRGDPHDVHGATLDCGNAGTTMRLLAGAIAGRPIEATLDGDASLRSRPMERVASLLRATGATVTTTGGGAPMRVRGRSALDAVTHELPVASAQLLGATVLAALAADGVTRIASPGPTRDHTERMLAAAGVSISRDDHVTTVHGPARPRPISMTVPGDPSSAAPWLVAAALHPTADLTVTDVALNPTRTGLVRLLQRMGADVTATVTDADASEPIGDIRVGGGRPLEAAEIAGDEVAELIDELPLVGVLMAAAEGRSTLRDARELRVKESDRISTTVAGLDAIGAHVEERPDGWVVSRGTPRDAEIRTHGDHRIAIAFAVAGLAGLARSVVLDDPACVGVSYPTFWSDLAQVTA